MSLNRFRVVAGFCGMVALFLVFSFIYFAIRLSLWFDWGRNMLSELGVAGIAALLFNSALIVGGLPLFLQ